MKRIAKTTLHFTLAATTLVCLNLNSAHASKAGRGALLGALVGGVVGNQVSDKNKERNTVIGAAVGLAVGHAIGQVQDDLDRQEAERARQAALDSRQRQAWQGRYNSGEVVVINQGYYRESQSTQCLQYREVIHLANGTTQESTSQSCRFERGWEEVNSQMVVYIPPPAQAPIYQTPVSASPSPSLMCVGINYYGKYASGGGCNSYGCYAPGGGCNSYGCYAPGGGCNYYGCYSEGGTCNTYGCIRKVPSRPFQCYE